MMAPAAPNVARPPLSSTQPPLQTQNRRIYNRACTMSVPEAQTRPAPCHGCNQRNYSGSPPRPPLPPAMRAGHVHGERWLGG